MQSAIVFNLSRLIAGNLDIIRDRIIYWESGIGVRDIAYSNSLL